MPHAKYVGMTCHILVIIVKSSHNYNKGMGVYFFFNPNLMALAPKKLNYMHTRINKTRSVADQSFICVPYKICSHDMSDTPRGTVVNT